MPVSRVVNVLRGLLAGAGLAVVGSLAPATGLPEYQLKAAFLYNFANFTEWPAAVGATIQLCVYGPDPFGSFLDDMDGAKLGGRKLAVRRTNQFDALATCNLVFVATPALSSLPRIVEAAKGKPLLTIVEGGEQPWRGAAITLTLDSSRVAFEVNMTAVRDANLTLSSKLLRLARDVRQ
jgi:hypothetical protein